MNYFDTLQRDCQLHKKVRTTKHVSYPARFAVPDNKIAWEVSFPEYHPAEFNAPIVLGLHTLWVDPQDINRVTLAFKSFEGKVRFNNNGIPLNPSHPFNTTSWSPAHCFRSSFLMAADISSGNMSGVHAKTGIEFFANSDAFR